MVFGRFGYYIFVSDSEVINIGMRIMNTIAPFYFTYIAIELMSGAIRGAGRVLIPTLFTVIGICGMRILWLSVPALCQSIELVVVCYPVSWTLVSLLFFIYYRFGNIYGEKSAKLRSFKEQYKSRR